MKDLILGSFRAFPRAVMEITVLNSLINPTYENSYLAVSILFNMIVIFIAKTFSKQFSSSYPELIYRPGFVHSSNPKFNYKSDIDNGINKIGMPSGHSSMAWFLATYFILKLWNKNKNKNNIKNNNLKYLLSVIIILFATSISISRTDLIEGCHTYLQVVLGGIFGIIFGLVVYYLKDYIKNKFIKSINKQ